MPCTLHVAVLARLCSSSQARPLASLVEKLVVHCRSRHIRHDSCGDCTVAEKCRSQGLSRRTSGRQLRVLGMGAVNSAPQVLCRASPHWFQPLCRDHLILGQQFSEGTPGSLAQRRPQKKAALMSVKRAATHFCSLRIFYEKGEHDLREHDLRSAAPPWSRPFDSPYWRPWAASGSRCRILVLTILGGSCLSGKLNGTRCFFGTAPSRLFGAPESTRGTCDRLRSDSGRPSLEPLRLVLTDRSARRPRKCPQQFPQRGRLNSRRLLQVR